MEKTVKVSESSLELMDILKQFDVAYDMFYAYIKKHYGNNIVTKTTEDFYEKWCDVVFVVEDFLGQSMVGELRDTKFTSI